MNIKTYFENLGFTSKETEIFLALYKLGTKPASTIAKHLNMERTYVYKSLVQLSQSGLISETVKGGVKHFFIPDINIIKSHIKKKIDNFSILENNFEIIKTQLEKSGNNKQMYIPKISIFDGLDGVNNIYDDILVNIQKNGYICIKFFASNTLESQGFINLEIKNKTDNFYETLKKQKITVESYLGNGVAIMENIVKNYDIDSLKKLPAGNSAINIFIVGKAIYILIFKDYFVGLKIDNEDLAYAMHFLFDNLKG